MTIKEASTQLWFFESHNNTKRSQWLQSTLSELEDKTKVMLKLIEGDADTFSQRAEMYYKKRPELINMIEDFYRSYRSLAESYDQLKLESGNSLLNRRFSLTKRSFTNESLTSSLVTSDSDSDSDSDSEVDDSVQEVERKLKEVQEYPKKCMLEKSTEKKIEVCVVKPMVEEIRSKKNILIEDYAKAASKMQINDKKEVSVYPRKEETHGDIELAKLTHSEFDFKLSSVSYPEYDLEEFPETKSEICVIKPMIEIKPMLKLSEATKNCVESEVERLNGEIASYKVELGQKDEEKREVIRQLSASVDILKGENDRMKKVIRDSKNRGRVFELGILKDVFCKNPFGKHFRFPTPLVAV